MRSHSHVTSAPSTAPLNGYFFNDAAGEDCDTAGDSAACDADCTAVACGDGYTNMMAGEQCEEGGDSPECDSDCTFAACGDGYVNTQAVEECDDGNVDACGTCNASCSVVQLANEATGEIYTVNNVGDALDGQTLVIGDGINQAVTFEFHSTGDAPDASRVTITLATGASERDVRDAIIAAVNAQREDEFLQVLAFTLQPGTNRLGLEHDLATSLGNVDITGTATSTEGGLLTVAGMSGGVAGDCTAGTGCNSDDDCAPGLTCDASTNTCQ